MAIQGGYKVKWKTIQIGDHASISYEYHDNTDIRIIPRAKGVKIWSTYELGGGYLIINVNAVVARNSRLLLESYFKNLDSTFELNTVGDLVIIDKDSNTYTLTNCYLQNFTQSNEDLKVNTFSMKFVKSL